MKTLDTSLKYGDIIEYTCAKKVTDEGLCVAEEESYETEGEADTAEVYAADEKTHDEIFSGAVISEVVEESPAWCAGLEPGCVIVKVQGKKLSDSLAWNWYAAEDSITIEGYDTEGDAFECELERNLDEDWGLSFEGALYDKVKTCRNNCIFCFMKQLPRGLRRALYVRDDDFRLCFLTGTFITLTNMNAEDEARIVEQHISPLRMSFHAYDSHVRERMIGKYAAHGLSVLKRLLAAGIEFQLQIVLMKGVNDGEVLKETLDWAYTQKGVLSVGIVPVGYTRYQDKICESFNEPCDALELLEFIRPYQERAFQEKREVRSADCLAQNCVSRSKEGATNNYFEYCSSCGPWVYASDEFYCAAFGDAVLDYLPEAAYYGDFELYEDGIGMLRSFVSDWRQAYQAGDLERLRRALVQSCTKVCSLTGYSFYPAYVQLVNDSGLLDYYKPCAVRNGFFGGNVDVTGLLCGEDLAKALVDVLMVFTEEEQDGSFEESFRSSSDFHSLLPSLNLQNSQDPQDPQDPQESQSLQESQESQSLQESQGSQTSQRPLTPPNSQKAPNTPAPFASFANILILIPSIVFNIDGLTLDDMSFEDIVRKAESLWESQKSRGHLLQNVAHVWVAVVSCNIGECIVEIEGITHGSTSCSSGRQTKCREINLC